MKDTIVEILGRANGAAVTRADLREVMRTDRPTAWGKPTGKKLTDSQTTLVGKAITDLIEDGTLEHLEVTVGASKMAALALAPPTQRTGSAAMPTKVGAVAARWPDRRPPRIWRLQPQRCQRDVQHRRTELHCAHRQRAARRRRSRPHRQL